MRRTFTLCLALAGCSADKVPDAINAQAQANKETVKERAADGVAIRAGFVPAQPAPIKIVSVDPPPIMIPGTALPNADREYRYIGRWAPSAAQCRGGDWRFRTRNMTTSSRTACDLPTVAAVPTGYELTGTCEADGRKTEDTLRLSFDEKRHTMHVAAKTLRLADLIYCGD